MGAELPTRVRPRHESRGHPLPPAAEPSLSPLAIFRARASTRLTGFLPGDTVVLSFEGFHGCRPSRAPAAEERLYYPSTPKKRCGEPLGRTREQERGSSPNPRRGYYRYENTLKGIKYINYTRSEFSAVNLASPGSAGTLLPP